MQDETVSVVISEILLAWYLWLLKFPYLEGAELSNFGNKWMYVRLKRKGTAHEHCTPDNKIVSRRLPVNNADTAIHAYEVKQLNGWQVVRARLLTVGVGVYK